MLIPYNWKVVLRDALGNEHLMSFCNDMKEAKTKMAMAEVEITKNNACGELALKAVNPEWIPDPIKTDYTMFVRSLIPDTDWERIKQIPSITDFFDNDHGRMKDYYLLSKIIPKYYTVINFGCSNNAQSYLFTQHKKYIAVDTAEEQLRAPSTTYYQISAKKFINDIMPQLNLNMQKTFAICSNVTGKGGENPGMLTRMHFLNMFTINNYKI